MGPDDGTTKTEERSPPVHSSAADPSEKVEKTTTSNKDDVIFLVLSVEATRPGCYRSGGAGHRVHIRVLKIAEAVTICIFRRQNTVYLHNEIVSSAMKMVTHNEEKSKY